MKDMCQSTHGLEATPKERSLDVYDTQEATECFINSI